MVTGRPDTPQQPVVDAWSCPTTVYAQAGAAARVLGGLGPARVVFVTDEDVWSSCRAVRDAAGALALDEVVTRTSRDTDLAALDRILAAIGRHGDAVVVAAGGGRVMDVARLAGLLSVDVRAMAHLRPRLETAQGLVMWPAARDASCPVVCVPTTIGTAAEVSPVAMVRTASSTAMVVSPTLRSGVAVLDPDVTSTFGDTRLRGGLVEPLSRALVPAVCGEPLALQDGLARGLVTLLLGLGHADSLDATWRLTAASVSTQTHTAFLSLGRSPFGHALWPLATELTAELGISKSEALAVLMPAWLEGLAVGALSRAFGAPERVVAILDQRPEQAAALLRDWFAAVVPSGGTPLGGVDRDLVVSRTIDRWQVAGTFLQGASRQELAWLLSATAPWPTAPWPTGRGALSPRADRPGARDSGGAPSS